MRNKLIAAALGCAAVAAVVIAGSAPANAATPDGAGTAKVATTQPVPGLNNGESARFVITDSGTSLTIRGRGRGMGGPRLYVSLLYPDNRCSQTETPSPLTLDGAWQAHGADGEFLLARYTGDAYRAVRGHVGSLSVREITSVTNVGGGNFALVATARACAPVIAS